MSLSQAYAALYAAQSALPAFAGVPPAAPRVHPDVSPDRVRERPYCVIQQVSNTVYTSVCGNDPAGDDLRFQIDIYADQFDEALSLREQSIAALTGITTFAVTREADNPLPAFDADARAFRRSFDVTVSLSTS